MIALTSVSSLDYTSLALTVAHECSHVSILVCVLDDGSSTPGDKGLTRTEAAARAVDASYVDASCEDPQRVYEALQVAASRRGVVFRSSKPLC